MKKIKIFVFFFSLLFLTNCKLLLEPKNDFPTCQGDCTIVRGRLVTDNRQTPIANAEVQIWWGYSRGWSGGEYRKKAKAITDSQGNFTVSFFIADDELRSLNNFYIHYITDQNVYFDLDNTVDATVDYFPNSITLTRNATFDISAFLIPKIAYAKFVKQQNIQITDPNDYFNTELTGSYGVNTATSFGCDWIRYPLDIIQIPANYPLTVKTIRIKSGVRTEETENIMVRDGETITISKTF